MGALLSFVAAPLAIAAARIFGTRNRRPALHAAMRIKPERG